jgi:2,4-didehydro-3-deoxy-L-rhamnonate hydrolase
VRIANVRGRLALHTAAGVVDVETASAGRFGFAPELVYPRWAEFRSWADDLLAADSSGGLGDRAAEPAPGELGPPSPTPAQIFAVGLNYTAHAAESRLEVPAAPLVFTKFRSSLAGPAGDLELPPGSVDWEVELVVVIGAPAYRVPVEAAWDVVAGLTVGQDFSEREMQGAGSAPQFSMGKSFPGFAPTGPVLVTVDELPDRDDLSLTCQVNDEVVQSGRTRDMIFSVPELIARISAVCRLEPGDLIFTGTPDGTGFGMVPPRFLEPGDVVVSEIEGIGRLSQRCVPAAVTAEAPLPQKQPASR